MCYICDNLNQDGTDYIMKVTVVITICNEADTIEILLSALDAQTRKPDEVVIIDGGSRDGTMEVIKERGESPTLKVVAAPGTNISQGRNQAVRVSTSELLAVTDGGCRPHPTWLENLLSPFAEQSACDLVCGSYRISSLNDLEDCIGQCSSTARLRIQGQAVKPTARSLAFTRTVWQAVGGFPEETEVLDDLGFVLAATNAGYRMRIAPDAIVDWRPRSSYRAVRHQFYLYSRDIARGGYTLRVHTRTLIWDILMTALLVWEIFFPNSLPWIVLPAIFAVYLLRQARRGCFSTPGWRKLYRVPLILANIHIGVVSGIATGLFTRIRFRLFREGTPP